MNPRVSTFSRAAVAWLLAAALCFPSCAVNPVTGEKELMLLSKSQEKVMGKQTDEEIVSTYGVYDDPALERYVSRIGQGLVPHSHRWEVENTSSRLLIGEPNQRAVIVFFMPSGSSALRAARDFVSASGATVLASEAVQVNGMAAQRVIASWYTEQGEVKGMVTFIEKDGSVFAIQGLTAAGTFDAYEGAFRRTMTRFDRLDPGRTRKEPSRIRVRTVPDSGVLRSALKSLGVTGEDLEFHALLNGMYLEDRVEAGTKLKVVSNRSNAE